MEDNKRKYLKILRIEIEDLKRDVEVLIDGCKHEYECKMFTNYVFLENMIVFHHELFEVEYFSDMLNRIDPDRYENLNEMVQSIKGELTGKMKELLLPKVICDYINRKLLKLQRFVEEDHLIQ